MAGAYPDRTHAKERPTYYWRVGAGAVYMPEADWEDPYGRGSVSFDGGPGLNLAGGVYLGVVPVRFDLEWLYQANGISDITSDQPVIEPVEWATVSMSALVFNGYIDFRNKSAVTPYVMAGFGYGDYSIELEEDNVGTTSVSLFQAGGGILCDVKTTASGKYKIILDAGYRFAGSRDPEIDEALGGVYKTEYTSHAIMLGVLFKRTPTQNTRAENME